MQAGTIERGVANCRQVSARLTATCRVKAAAAVERWPVLGRVARWLTHPLVVAIVFAAALVLVETWLINAWMP